MKSVTLICLALLLVSGCGSKDEPRKYSGKVFVDHMTVNGTGAAVPAAAFAATSTTPHPTLSPDGRGYEVALLSDATSSLSDLATTITTSYQGGDISISGHTHAMLQGSILNDTPDTVQGFWYCAMEFPGPNGPQLEGYWGDTITIGPGSAYPFQGGLYFESTATRQAAPGPMVWTTYFFDTTADPSAPQYDVMATLVYAQTHTARAIGTISFTVIP
jgi:hypothetical protein